MTSTDLTIQDEQTFWTERQVAALKQIGVEDATNADLAVFFHQSVRTGLDPFARQIYMIGRNSFDSRTKSWVTKQTIQTGIDGFRLIARRAADHAGVPYSISDILWCGPDAIWHDVWLGQGQPSAAKVTVYRDGQAFPAVALFSEYAGTKKDGGLTSMWAKGALMLGKCVEALALRKAFPQDLSGLYTGDEIAAEGAPPAIEQESAPRRVSAEEITRSRPKADEPVDADVVEDTPQTGDVVAPAPTGSVEAVAAEPPLATASPDLIPPAGKQMKALHAALNEQGLGERDAGLEYLSEVVGRTLTTSKELTVAEASRCIDLLKAVNEDPFREPPEEPM